MELEVTKHRTAFSMHTNTGAETRTTDEQSSVVFLRNSLVVLALISLLGDAYFSSQMNRTEGTKKILPLTVVVENFSPL